MTWRVLFAVTAAVVISSTPTVVYAASPPLTVTVSRTQIYPDSVAATWTDLRLRVDPSTGPIRITLLRGGYPVGSRSLGPGGGTVTFDGAELRSGAYLVRVAAGAGLHEVPIRIHRGWAPLALDRPTWPRCARVTWRYDDRRAPASGARGVRADMAAATRDISTATGLRLREVQAGPADILLRWGDTGRADGIGGLQWTDGPGSAIRGFITLGIRSAWARTPGTADRQVLLRHELLHAVGLGHVDLPRALMAPTYRLGISRPNLGPGEVRGLTTLYRPGLCRR